MAEKSKPVLQKPPGYRDPNTPISAAPKPPIRKPPLPSSFHPKRKRNGCCRFCCCFFCISILILIILVAVAGALFYLWFEPKLPTFHLQSLQISHFDVSVKPDGTFLNSRTVARFKARNPNGKITFYYGRAKVRITVDEDVDLGSVSIPGFTQGRRNTTVLKFGTKVTHMLVDDSVGAKLKARFRSKKLVVRVEVRTRFGLGVERWKMGMLGVKVLCGDVSLKKLEAGAMPRCTVNLLRWINLHLH